MTTAITFSGHVESIAMGGMNNIRVEVRGSSLYVHSRIISLLLSKSQAEGVLPGTQVDFAVSFRPETDPTT